MINRLANTFEDPETEMMICSVMRDVVYKIFDEAGVCQTLLDGECVSLAGPFKLTDGTSSDILEGRHEVYCNRMMARWVSWFLIYDFNCRVEDEGGVAFYYCDRADLWKIREFMGDLLN